MDATATQQQVSDQIGACLPYLRRYARALTGSQSGGDQYAIATLEAILQDRSILTADKSVKVSLFSAFHSIWSSTGAPVDRDETGLRAKAQKHLARLTENTREALLLHTVEDFDRTEVAQIMQTDTDEVNHLLQIAHEEMARSVSGRVMIIEDEAVIAMDIESIVSDVGHQVVGIARTRAAAVEMGNAERPDLILADIQLADNSSGIDAVNDLLPSLGDVPVIFITAFPERLLTGERPEPAFLISKPYKEEQVRSAVSQAMFFSSTEPLKV
ncbi:MULTISPECIES: response regulator [unclassified Marinovum]